MLIGEWFDRENEKDRRIRVNRNALKTAEKLNLRMKNFLGDIDKNGVLTNNQKKEIRERLLKDL